MRLAYKVWSGIAAGVFCVVAAADVGGGPTPPPVPAASSSSVTAPSAARPAPAWAAAPAGEGVTVLQVIDGDSFRLADGREVRVLGIDSCEAATPGGARATAEARTRLLGTTVLLAAEPGVRNDRYGRMLRYVTAGGVDYASAMIVADHTAIYTDGRNDASVAVQSTLRGLDTNSRTCGSPAPTTTRTTSTPVPDPDPDVDRPRTPRAAPLAPRTRTSADPAPSGGSAYYANCSAARAAGAAPIRAGQPGYRAALDRDGDGTACDT